MVGEKLQVGPQSVTSDFNVEKLWRLEEIKALFACGTRVSSV